LFSKLLIISLDFVNYTTGDFKTEVACLSLFLLGQYLSCETATMRSKTMNTAQAVERMRQVIRRRHKALATEDCYIFWLRRYMAALRQMPADLTSEKKLEQFLTDLALRCDVAASTQNQALHAILYFYKFVLEHPTRS
jgi:site-specific recombinase XerD